MLKAQKVYLYEDKEGRWITTDEGVARQDKKYKLACLDEVEEFISYGCDIIPVVETSDGVYGFYEIEFQTTFGSEEVYMGYVYLQQNSEAEIRDLARMIDKMKMNT